MIFVSELNRDTIKLRFHSLTERYDYEIASVGNYMRCGAQSPWCAYVAQQDKICYRNLSASICVHLRLHVSSQQEPSLKQGLHVATSIGDEHDIHLVADDLIYYPIRFKKYLTIITDS